jgi:tetratricopeptide (TPR) repeat protein
LKPAKPVEISIEGRTEKDAPELYSRGYSLYWEKQLDEALANLNASVKLSDQDARAWYFKGLAERALGETAKAKESIRMAIKVQRQNRQQYAAVMTSLERVQGADRAWLDAIRLESK